MQDAELMQYMIRREQQDGFKDEALDARVAELQKPDEILQHLNGLLSCGPLILFIVGVIFYTETTDGNCSPELRQWLLGILIFKCVAPLLVCCCICDLVHVVLASSPPSDVEVGSVS